MSITLDTVNSLSLGRMLSNSARDVPDKTALVDGDRRITYRQLDQMAEDLGSMYSSMENAVDERTRQVITAAEVANLATSSPNLDELLSQSVELITDRFGFYHAAIFLLDDPFDDQNDRQPSLIYSA